MFSQTTSNKAYLCFIPLKSLPKKHSAIGFRKLLVVVFKCIRNTMSNNTKKEIND